MKRFIGTVKPLNIAKTVSNIGIVLILNTLVNVFNRFIAELWLCGDVSRRPLNSATLLFVVLLYLVTHKPCCFIKFCVGLLRAELLLQCFNFLWVTQLFSVQIANLFPFLCDTFVGSLHVFKLLLLLLLVYTLVYAIFSQLACFCFGPKPAKDDSCGSPDYTDSCSDDDVITLSVAPCEGHTVDEDGDRLPPCRTPLRRPFCANLPPPPTPRKWTSRRGYLN